MSVYCNYERRHISNPHECSNDATCGCEGFPGTPARWRAQQEANGEWSVYEGEGYRKGPFKDGVAAVEYIAAIARKDAPPSGSGEA